MPFLSPGGVQIPSVTADQMREVDRIAMEDFGLGLLQMMENAGRNLAEIILQELEDDSGPVLVLAGPGGNGGGGLSAARHLHNHGVAVQVVLAKSKLGRAAQNQLKVLEQAEIYPLQDDEILPALQGASIVIDALIGYSLRGVPSGSIAELIGQANTLARRTISLDVPSGIDATTGENPGVAIQSELTVTLALPKSGLLHLDGELILADIGIPLEAYRPLGIEIAPFFGNQYWIPLIRKT